MTAALRDILTAVREGRLEPADAARMLANPDTASEPTPEPVAYRVPEPLAPDSPSVEPSADGWADAVDDPTSAPRVPSRPAPDPTADGSADAHDTAARVETPSPVATATLERTPGDGPATTSLRLRAMTRRVRVVADAAVSTVSVEGPHELRREGSTLILESDRDLPFGDPFSVLPSMRGAFRLQAGRGLPLSLGSDLVVRVNPGIALDVDVTAGSLSVRGGSRVRARVTAGSARIEDVSGPLDLHVVGGTAKVDMAVRGGDNRIRCESGSITLRLRHDSDVRLRPDAQLGRITIDGVEGGRDIVVGAGTGRLDVEIVMGNLQVEVEEGPS